MTSAASLPSGLQSALADLLQGGDARVSSPYGLPLPASDDLVHLGSCTANPITPRMLLRHRAIQAQAASQTMVDPQAHLMSLFGAQQCVLAASGTDAEYSVALAMGARPYVCILMDPQEIGGGCLRAASGLPHVQGGPVSAALPLQVHMEVVRLRDATGQALLQSEVDEQVLRVAQQHPHVPLLVHHVACSKTGLSAPSESACRALQQHHPAGARVVVDASQGRFAHADVQRWLAWGWAVMLTGSKYWGAPPFCGATLFPANWPKAQGFAPTPGLMARWRLALQAMSQAQAQRTAWTQSLRQHFVPALQDLARIDTDTPEHIDRQGILSFDLGLDAEATRHLHRTLIAEGFFLGQPVAAGPRHLLRVALGEHMPAGHTERNLVRLVRAIQHEMAYG